MENIARVSLKTADKGTLASSSKKRRKASKNNSSHDDVCQKQCATKYLPLKDNEDNTEKSEGKPKKGVKFALKTTNQKKVLKRTGTVDHAIANKKMRMLQCKNKEKKTEESDILLERNELDAIDQEKINECSEVETNICTQLSIQNNSLNTKIITQGAPGTSTECSLSKS